MSENIFEETHKILIIGRSDVGKTYLSRTIQKCYPRVWVFDQLKEYWGESLYVRTWTDFERILMLIRRERPHEYRVVVQLEKNLKNKTQVLDEMIGHLYELQDCTLVLEEAHMLATVREMGENLRDAILTGKHRKLSMIFTTQRISLLHKTIGSQCQHVFCGNVFEMNDLEYLKKTFRFDPAEVEVLPDRIFLYFRPGQKILKVKNSLTK